MADKTTLNFWNSFLVLLEEKLQLGLLERTREVADVALIGSRLVLFVSNHEAQEFFTSSINQQRIMIVARPLASIETIEVKLVDANPIG